MESLKKVHIPTLIALVVLIIGIGVGVFLVKQKQRSQSSASTDILPKNIKISNQTAFMGSRAEVTISWQTLKPTTGFVLYGFSPTSLNFVSNDSRDKNRKSEKYYYNHYVELANLPPKKTIYYTLGINNEGIGQCANTHKLCSDSSQCPTSKCSPFSLVTPPALKNKAASLIQGQVVNKDHQPVVGALVYLNTQGSNLLSSLTDENGQWVINLSLIRQADLSSYLDLDSEASLVNLTTIYKSLKSSGSCLTANLNPAPPIILGLPISCQQKREQDETNSNQEKTASNSGTTKISPSPSIKGSFSPTELNSSSSADIKLLNPAYEGAKIATQSPLIRGIGPKGKKLEIIIHSNQQITANVYVDENGQWHWKPPANLAPGEHTITIKYTDDNGQEHTLTRHFYITSSGEAVDEETPNYSASTSAKLTTPTPSPSPTPLAKTSMPSTKSGIPKSGISFGSYFLFLSFISLTIGGWLLYSERRI